MANKSKTKNSAGGNKKNVKNLPQEEFKEEALALATSEEVANSEESASSDLEDYEEVEDLDEDDEDDYEREEEDEEEQVSASTSAPSEPASKQKKERGPRKICYVASGFVDGESKSDTIKVTVTKGIFDRKKGDLEARQIFESTHGIAPEYCHGPFYFVRDPAATAGKKRDTLNQSAGIQYGLTSRRASAIHKGWSVIANFTKNPSFAMVQYMKLVDLKAAGVKDGKKPQRPNTRYVPVNTLTNVKDINDESVSTGT